MKTAEQFELEFDLEYGSPCLSTIEERTQLIKAIQLDAYKQGVNDALKIQMETPPSEHFECSKKIATLLEDIVIKLQ